MVDANDNTECWRQERKDDAHPPLLRVPVAQQFSTRRTNSRLRRCGGRPVDTFGSGSLFFRHHPTILTINTAMDDRTKFDTVIIARSDESCNL